MSTLARLAAELRAEGGLLASAVADPNSRRATHGEAVGKGEEYALLVEAIREGYELHYGDGRVVRSDDGDLALLAGDRLYALGLARLAALGDLEAVAELADLISLCAQFHAERRPGDAATAWDAAVAAIGAGPSRAHEAAKRDWRRGRAS